MHRAHDRACTGLDAAAQRPGNLQRDAIQQLDDIGFVSQRMARERGLSKKPPLTAEPERRSVAEPSVREPPKFNSRMDWQYAEALRAHAGHRPQAMKVMTTRSPGLTFRTAEPTRSTMPEPSWPNTAGNGKGKPPACATKSVWHMPTPAIRTRTSSSRGSSSSSSTIWKGARGSSARAAVIRMVVSWTGFLWPRVSSQLPSTFNGRGALPAWPQRPWVGSA